MRSCHVGVFVLLTMHLSISMGATPNLVGNIERPLRYRPDHGGFVIENGPDSFNRPLYGGNTAFRADAGDKPEFSLYVPGRGGNLRLGISTPAGAKWLREMSQIVTRYQDGAMCYEIHDALLGSGAVRLEALGLYTTEGLIVRIDPQDLPHGSQLIVAFGGANGDRGSRGGDIGTEREPVSQFFSLRPEYCRNNRFDVTGNTFILQSRPAPGKIAGVLPAGSQIAIGDATKWDSPGQLLSTAGQLTQSPVIVGNVNITGNDPLYLSLQRLADGNADAATTLEAPRVSSMQETGPQSAALLPAFAGADVPRVYEQTRQHFMQISHQVSVDTPDEFINSMVPALCLASDAIWDEPSQAIMHGGVAWRTKLLGWRGPYTCDALGWHDRIVQHLENWFPKQNVDPINPILTGADADSDLARSEKLLHTNGDLTRSHYDMNMVAIDTLFRHLLWTGDIEYAKKTWPVVQRHLAWERRLFRREFGPDKLPLYEAYACIWASDDLDYNGGGATHSTAYNYWHNVMAARIASMIGEDPAPYAREAELILKGMQQYLWLSDRGWYAEYKDLLGNRLVHPSAALWTIYHSIDSRAANPFQAWQMSRYVETQIPHIPLKGENVPPGLFNLSSTNWMPYTWSINNVAMAETVHTALADWQAGRDAQAFATFKGAILDSMFLGQCPGNLHMTSYFDPNRRESQRDSGDPVGITSRALVEGLFGIEPDALEGELTIQPGFPREWDHASIRHPDLSFTYQRSDATNEIFTVESRFSKPMSLRLQIPARRVQVASVIINGQQASWRAIEDAVGDPRIEIVAEPAQRWEIAIRWDADEPASPRVPRNVVAGTQLQLSAGPAAVLEVMDPQGVLEQAHHDERIVTGIPGLKPWASTAFVKLRQGQMTWWSPIEFQSHPALDLVGGPVQQAATLKLKVRNFTDQPIDAPAQFTTMGGSTQMRVRVAAHAESDEIALPAANLLPGVNRVSLRCPAGTAEGEIVNWNVKPTLPAGQWEMIDLTGMFNDRVTQIFKNRYLSPRSPYASLSIPADGIGGWATFSRTAQIDDSGLRRAASANDGELILPNGIPIRTPGTGDAKNIAFTSQWDNYPHEITVPLSGAASHAYFLMAGSTNPMQSRFENGQVIVTYTDGSARTLSLVNPTNWWPIERDYFVDDYSFARPEPLPPRIDLRTGRVRITDPIAIKGEPEMIPGGAATLLDLPLDRNKTLKSLTVRTVANEVVIGLMGVTLAR